MMLAKKTKELPTFVPFSIMSLLGYMYGGPCYLERKILSGAGETVYELADYDESSDGIYPRKITYQQVIDYLEFNGIDISHQFVRQGPIREHRFLVFREYEGRAKHIKEIHVINKDKYIGYELTFIKAIALLKNGL